MIKDNASSTGYCTGITVLAAACDSAAVSLSATTSMATVLERGETISVIGHDGIMRFKIDANDENAVKFIECIEWQIGRRLTGIEVEKVNV